MKKEETFSKKRMGQITAILFILCLIFATPHLITADEMYHPTNSQSPLTFNPCRNMIIKPYTDDCGDYPAPQWEFVTLPDSIMTSYYDYMPFSYRGFHIMQQTENGDSWYMTWFGIPDLDPSTNRRQYYAEIGADGSLLDWNLISSNDIWQGYGDICIHPATGLPIATWHEDNPSSGGGITISYPDSTWPGSYTFFPPTNPGENVYMWPQIYIGPSPEGSGYCRIYLISRKLDDNPYGSPCETPRILFIDVENINDPSVLEPILEFDNWNEVNPMQDWWQNDIRPYKLNFAIDYINPGIVALMGSAANLSGYDNPPVNDGPFVWISQDYGATWDESNLYGISDTTGVLYYVENIPRYVPDDDSIKVIDMLGHSTGLFDNQGEIHFPFRQGYSSIGGTSNYFANYFINANQHWSSDNGLWFDNVPSLGGADPLSGHTVPWEVQPAKTDTVLYYAQAGVYTDELYQEGVFKIAANNQNGWMVNIWEDGTYHYLNQQGFPGFSAYDEHPLLFMSASNDNGETWSAPIKLTDIDNPAYDFSDEITVFPAICRRIKNLGDGWGLVTLAYFDDNSFGSYVQGQGDNTGGTIKYMQVKINFADIGNSVSQEPDEHDFNLISNSPNPFKYSTQISLANQTSEKIRNIEIYNIKGQKVKTLSVTDAGSPAISVIWDGTDSENRKVGAGIYYIKLRTDKGVHFKKVVKLSR